ncbi:Retrovirus-related Pol polyprotein from transposon opus, partial [Mucuna pruriens]
MKGGKGAFAIRLMDRIFKDRIGLDLEVYVNDMVIKLAQGEQHFEVITRVFDVLRKNKLKLNPEKCFFGVQVGKFLGYMLTRSGIEANLDKSAKKVLPVFQSLRRSKRFQWTKACESTFQELKAMLASPPVLSKPNEDGASNQKGSGAKIMLVGPDGVLIEKSLQFKFKASNNQGEYDALLAGIRLVKEIGAQDPIATFLPTDEVLTHPLAIKKLRREAAKYTLIPQKLYRRGFSYPLLKCLDLDEVEYAMKEIHKGIICRFGLPGIRVSNNDMQFTSQLVVEFCSQLGIKQAFTSIKHPQLNGQLESINRVILRGLRRRLEEAKGRWIGELSQVFPRKLKKGNLILRTVLKDNASNKLKPNWEVPYRIIEEVVNDAFRLEHLDGKKDVFPSKNAKNPKRHERGDRPMIPLGIKGLREVVDQRSPKHQKDLK